MRLLIISVFFLSLTACNAQKNPNTVLVAGVSTQISGEQLFKVNCSQCHKSKDNFTGPSLAGVAKRWKSKALLYEFIRSSEDVIARDAYAKALYKKWNQAYMQPFSNLSNKDIDAILKYCNKQVVK